MATLAEVTRRDRCRTTPPSAVLNGAARRPDHVIGHGPILLGGFLGPTATPALVMCDGPRVSAKFYVMFARRGPGQVTLTGWRRGHRGERLRFGDISSRRNVLTLVVRRRALGSGRPFWHYLYQPSGLVAPRPGCYTITIAWGRTTSSVGIDLTTTALRRPAPATGAP